MSGRNSDESGMVSGSTSSTGFELYTDGETFIIRQRHPDHAPLVRVTKLTREEAARMMRTFAPYFSGHDFGIVED